ncbi:MAG: NAD(P)-dependent oxidoreductase [Acidimicrobiales bacterium]
MAAHTIALLGTGIMGAGMGRSMLREGLAVRAWNRTTAKAEPLADGGATVCAEAEEAVRGAQVIVTMLTDTDAVIEVADRVLDGAEDGAVWLQMSTIGVEGSDRAAEVASRHGVTLVDAPVSGTREPAEAGKLVVLASGPESARAACAPVLDAVGGRTVWLGEEVGKGKPHEDGGQRLAPRPDRRARGNRRIGRGLGAGPERLSHGDRGRAP